MGHSYEELRAAAIDIITERKPSPYPPNQFEHLAVGVAAVFAGPAPGGGSHYPVPSLSGADKTLLLEVFWDLFRDGIITIGLDGSNDRYPHFRLSRFGHQALAGAPYWFHDVSTYERVVRENVPSVDPVTLMYAGEAMRAFSAGCLLSAAVMIGAASEHTFLLVQESTRRSGKYRAPFAPVDDEQTILRKVTKFKRILEQHLKDFPNDVREGLDTRFAGVLETIRKIRNDSGHPTGELVGRETVYTLLQLFIPYCKKMHELTAYFRST